MTTSHSHPEKLLEQSKKIVQILKGYQWPVYKEELTFGILMDDKVIKLTLPKTIILRESAASLEAMIFAHMSGETMQ